MPICIRCNGKRMVDCPTCGGKGLKYMVPLLGVGALICSGCNGLGHINCPVCDGHGEI